MRTQAFNAGVYTELDAMPGLKTSHGFGYAYSNKRESSIPAPAAQALLAFGKGYGVDLRNHYKAPHANQPTPARRHKAKRVVNGMARFRTDRGGTVSGRLFR